MGSSGASDFLAAFDALAQAVRRARGANGRGMNGRAANGRAGSGRATNGRSGSERATSELVANDRATSDTSDGATNREGANGSGANGGQPHGRPADGSLTLSQYGLLEVLADQDSARVQELAAHAGITASTATRILDALERRGVVRRTRSDEDRRAVAVSLTDLGDQLLHAEQDWLRGRQRSFYAALPPAEQELAPDLLFRLAALIDDLAAGPGQDA